ncbi:uncharacterized protein [Rutidosis leptorrhynchoides]|uniref:uncharacterized protein n=1 Tax=Rutidosis leptorrhynchoides TaxID=125765 RepID=UPI003A9A3F38
MCCNGVVLKGNLHDLSVNSAWNVVRYRSDPVHWYYIVWFAQCIPKHSFLVWLLMGEWLKTQDKLKAWEINPHIAQVYSLCLQEPDSHDVVELLIPMAAKRKVNVIVTKLLFGATIYDVWRERNARLFKKKPRSSSQVFDLIYSTAQLKIMSIKWKNSMQVQEMKADWKVP